MISRIREIFNQVNEEPGDMLAHKQSDIQRFVERLNVEIPYRKFRLVEKICEFVVLGVIIFFAIVCALIFHFQVFGNLKNTPLNVTNAQATIWTIVIGVFLSLAATLLVGVITNFAAKYFLLKQMHNQSDSYEMMMKVKDSGLKIAVDSSSKMPQFVLLKA